MTWRDNFTAYLWGWDEEQRHAALWTRATLTLIVLFIASGVFSCGELRYSVFGHRAQARITDVRPAPAISNDARTVRYSYADDGRQREGIYTFEPGPWDPPADGVIEVIYIPGSSYASKPVTERRWWAVAIFIAMTATLGGWFAAFYMQYRRDNNPPPPRAPARRAGQPRGRNNGV